MAHNFSGYVYPSNTTTTAELFVHNSADLSGANSTLQPLYQFAANETAQGRTVAIGGQSRVLPNYFSIFSGQPGYVDEGAGGDGLLGSRLLPLSTFQGSTGESLIQFLEETPFSIQFLWGQCLIQVRYQKHVIDPLLDVFQSPVERSRR